MWFGVRDYHLARKFCFHDISNSSLRKYTIPFGFLRHTTLTLSAQDNLCQFHRMWQAPYCQCQAPLQSGRIYDMERLSRSGFRLNTRCVRETARHRGRQVYAPRSMKCRRLPCPSLSWCRLQVPGMARAPVHQSKRRDRTLSTRSRIQSEVTPPYLTSLQFHQSHPKGLTGSAESAPHIYQPST